MPLRVSIRYKVLLLVLAVVLAALATYLTLAITLFNRDKLAYVYDLNATLAHTLAEEIQSSVRSLADRLLFFAAARPHAPPADRRKGTAARTPAAANADLLFRADPDVLSVEIWAPQRGGDYSRVYQWIDPDRLAKVGVAGDDLLQARSSAPIPWAAAVAAGLYLQNASLPPDLALITMVAAVPGSRDMVVADIRPDRFLRIFGTSGIYKAYLVDSRGTVLAHPEPSRVLNRATLTDTGVVNAALKGRAKHGVLAFRSPAGEDFIGAFSAVEAGGLTVITEIPRSEALAAGRELVWRSILFAIGILFVCVLASIFFSRRLAAPIRNLAAATEKVAGGDFGVRVTFKSSDEVGALAEAFNHMAQGLLDRDQRLEESHQQLLQSSKLAVVGEMAAGISHEVKNPMVGMRGFAQLGMRSKTVEEAHEYFGMIEKETTRAREILEGLLRFTRQQQSERTRLGVNDLVNKVVRLVRHQLQTANIVLNVQLADGLPAIEGNENELQQVLLNLMINAQHAMQGKAGATLTVSTERAAGGEARISVRDTGIGMTAETRGNLFRAFFSTKGDKGTGLGLSVSQRIVTRHQGRIEVESELGQGSVFHVTLPAAPADAVVHSAA